MNRGSTIGGEPPHLEVFTDLPWALIDSGFGTKPVVVCGLLCKCSMYLWQTDYYYEYTECDSTGSRWRVAIPQSPGSCTGLPQPVKGTEINIFNSVIRVYHITVLHLQEQCIKTRYYLYSLCQ
ncbi:hypothetical protein XENOCAPTIV_002130 [Xenoophorus captivus]|uniref:Uncharacterized protein n=1 Tax=Xenoophorus captivus TaxID=1517983 RepID=A0ABV0Q7I4_9TELE